MKNFKFLYAAIALLMLPLSSLAEDGKNPTLCFPKEKTSISFRTLPSNKIASICEGPDDSYLVYRFGVPGNVELTFPKNPSKDSWQKFTFSGYQRPGGAENDGMGDYSLSFTSGNTSYTILQNWREINKNYYVGILVEMKGRHVKIKGLQPSQTGSLVLLENKALLQNKDEE